MKNTKLPEICIYLYKNEKNSWDGEKYILHVIIGLQGKIKLQHL